MIGVPRENNPYKDTMPKSAWDKGYMLTKVNYNSTYTAELRLAGFLHYPLPRRDTFTRAMDRRPRPEPIARPVVQNNVPRTPHRAIVPPKPSTHTVYRHFKKYQTRNETGAFRVEHGK